MMTPANNHKLETCSVIEKFSISLSNNKMGTFFNMMNVIAEGIFVVNADGIIEIINPIAAKFFGSSHEALVGQPWFHNLT
jgi:PAS domain-containing protein